MREALALQDPNTVAVTHAGEEEIFTDPNQELVAQEPADPLGVSLAYFPTAEGYYDYRNNRYIYQYKDHLGNVRLSYARNSTSGSIEVLDRNDYYAFGMNMYEQNSLYDAMGTPLNYKYNQKELQETGFYDYGWRHYMPDLGRWFGMDQLSETYHSSSPYAYVMNNPVMFLDPDGRYTQGSGDNWLQDMWNNTTSYSSWSNTGNGSFTGGEVPGGMSHDNFTSFYNFLSSGQTGNYTYFTGTASTSSSYNSSQGAYNGNIDLGVGHNITIKGHDDNSFGNFLNDAGNMSDFYDSMGGSLSSNAGNTRIGMNGRIYFPNANGRVFYGNQYVKTISWAEYGSKIGKVTGPLGYFISGAKIANGMSEDGWTYGKNAQVATAGAAGGMAGAWIGAKAGAAAGAEIGGLIGVWVEGWGAVPAGIVGGIIGGFAGGFAGGYYGGNYAEQKAAEWLK